MRILWIAIGVRIFSVCSTTFATLPLDFIKRFPSWSNWKRILQASTRKITFSGGNARVVMGEITGRIMDCFDVIFRQLLSTFAMKMSRSLTFQSMEFEEWAGERQLLVLQSDWDIFDHGIPISASCFNTGKHRQFFCFDDVTHLQPIRSIVRWQGLVTGSSSWLILFIPEHKSHVCFYLLHGAAWNKLLGAGISPQFPPPEGENIMVSSCYWEVHFLLRCREFLCKKVCSILQIMETPLDVLSRAASLVQPDTRESTFTLVLIYPDWNVFRGFIALIFTSPHVNT